MPRTPGFVAGKRGGSLGVGSRRLGLVTLAQGQFGAQPPGKTGVAGMAQIAFGSGEVARLITQRSQAVGIIELVADTGLQQPRQAPFFSRLLPIVVPADMAQQVGGEQLACHGLLQQDFQWLVRHGHQFVGELPERAVAIARAQAALAGVQLYGAVPVAGELGQAGLLAKAGHPQFERVAEAFGAEGTGLLESLSCLGPQRLRYCLHIVAGFEALGRQGPPQGVGRPGAAQLALFGGQRQHLVEVIHRLGMVAGVECHRAGDVEAQFIRQVGALRLHLLRILQGAQPRDLLPQVLRQLAGFDLAALRTVRAVVVVTVPVRRQGDFRGGLQACQWLAEAVHFESEITFRQLGQCLCPVPEQLHREIGATGQRRAKGHAQRQAQQVPRPVTGRHSMLLGRFQDSVPSRARAGRQPRHARWTGG